MSQMPFPAGLMLVPVSRRPLVLPVETVKAVMSRPLPAAVQAVPATVVSASIIIVTFNNLMVTRLCLESLLVFTPVQKYEVIIVDNASDDGTPDYLKEISGRFANVRIILNQTNRGFAPANNQALSVAAGEKLILLNNDTIVTPGWLERLEHHLDDPSVGLAGPVTNRIGNEAEIPSSYRTYGQMLEFAENCAQRQAGRHFEIQTLCMYCLGMRRDVFQKLGLLDEQFETGLLEDDDYSMRAHRAGYRVVCAEDVFVHHFGQASFGGLFATGEYGRILEANKKRYEEKWGVPWQPYQRRHGGDYLKMPERIRALVKDLVPEKATILVASKGDAALLTLDGQIGWHFPQNERGEYAGFHPVDSHAAISHLEELHAEGAGYIVFPSTGFWWLDYYIDFRDHLERRHRKIWQDDNCIIYQFQDLPAEAGKGSRVMLKEASKTTKHGRLPQPASHLRFVIDHPETLPLSPPSTPFDPRRMKLHWVLPDFAAGGGGPMVIFRFIRFLERFGHENTIWIRGGTQHGSADAARRVIHEHFLPLDATVRILSDNMDEICGDAVIATHCWTAYPVRSVTSVRERFYFIQDFEPLFFPMGSEYLLAEATYRFGFSCITSSRWLQNIMQTRYQTAAARFTYAYDPVAYHENGSPRATDRVAFYARSSTPRRAVELGILALELLARLRPSLVVDFFGAPVGSIKVPFAYHDHGVLGDAVLAALYRQATIGMVFSATNHSLIPHEMMACGLPVVDLMTESASSEFPLDAITLCEPTPSAIAHGANLLLGNADLRERQSGRAREYLKQLSWEKSARQIERVLVDKIVRDSGRPAFTKTPRITSENPAFGGPVVFAGQPEYYRSVYFDATSTGAHFEFPFTSASPDVLRELPKFMRDKGARTCIIFRPEWFSPYPETFAELKAMGIAVVGYSTEPVPQSWETAHSDQLQRLETLKKALRLDYDLLIHYDRTSLDFLATQGFNRLIVHPLPVSRKLFFPEDLPQDFEVCFLGKSTPHREGMLAPIKMRYNVIHVAHGMRDEEARMLMNRSRLVLNLHNDSYPNFENRVVQALFCSRPVLSEALTGNTLVAGTHYTCVESPDQLCLLVGSLLKAPVPPPPKLDTASFSIGALLQRIGISTKAGSE